MDSQGRSEPKAATLIPKFKAAAMAAKAAEVVGDVDLEEEEEEEVNDEFVGFGYGVEGGNLKKKKKAVPSGGFDGGGSVGDGGGATPPPCCQVDHCAADLSAAGRYHRRHKVCEVHAKDPVVVVNGIRQRFCQQCSRFHELSEFEDARRSCRSRLAGHNERRRKSSSERGNERVCQRQGNDRRRAPIALPRRHFGID